MNRTLIFRDLRAGTVAAKRLQFAYGRTLLLGRVVFLVVLVALVAFTVALTPSFPAITMAIIGGMLAAFALLFVISPLLTDHWLTRSRLILRQGWYFRAVIPFAQIETLTAADDAAQSRVPLGLHRPLGQPVLFITGGRTGLVSLRLREPQRFWQAFGLYARDLLFDVRDRDAFLAAFQERRTSLPPVQPDRPRAELRD